MICWKPTKFITLTTQGDQDVCICNCHLPCLLASLPLLLSLLLPQPSGIGDVIYKQFGGVLSLNWSYLMYVMAHHVNNGTSDALCTRMCYLISIVSHSWKD